MQWHKGEGSQPRTCALVRRRSLQCISLNSDTQCGCRCSITSFKDFREIGRVVDFMLARTRLCNDGRPCSDNREGQNRIHIDGKTAFSLPTWNLSGH